MKTTVTLYILLLMGHGGFAQPSVQSWSNRHSGTYTFSAGIRPVSDSTRSLLYVYIYELMDDGCRRSSAPVSVILDRTAYHEQDTVDWKDGTQAETLFAIDLPAGKHTIKVKDPNGLFYPLSVGTLDMAGNAGYTLQVYLARKKRSG